MQSLLGVITDCKLLETLSVILKILNRALHSALQGNLEKIT